MEDVRQELWQTDGVCEIGAGLGLAGLNSHHFVRAWTLQFFWQVWLQVRLVHLEFY